MEETYEVDPDGDLLISLAISVQDSSFVTVNDKASTEPPDGSHDTVDNVSNAQTRFRVSSKHLTVASRRFQKMLSGDWIEANMVYSDGYRHVDLEGIFDPKALRILLYILHGRTRKVPRTLDLETLAKVAVLVDDFGCHEAVEVWSDMWIDHLMEVLLLAQDSTEDLIRWILVSVVFHKPAIFKTITHKAILEESDPINTSGLPIPESVDRIVNHKRAELIHQLVNVLYKLIEDLRKDNNFDQATFNHDSILLGALLKQMDHFGIPWSRPEAPFSGFSFESIAAAITNFRTPLLHSCSAPYPTRSMILKDRSTNTVQQHWQVPSVCTDERNFSNLLTPNIKQLREGISGLDLKDHSWAGK